MTDTALRCYVSLSGNDTWSGLHPEPVAGGGDGPWATLEGARDGLRRLRRLGGYAGKPVTVVISTGTYELPATLVFTPEDGGTTTAPVRYIAGDGAAPVLSAGRTLTGLTETLHKDKRCWTCDLPEVASGTWNFNRLYVDQSPRQRPRLPRTGFHHFTGIAGYPDTGDVWLKGPDRANYAPGDFQNWRNREDVEVISYQLWFDTHHRIKSIDETTHTVHFHAKSLGSLRDEKGDFARYFVENVFEALEEPGQWYLDRPAGRLYYLPLANEVLGTTTLIAPRLQEVVRIQGDDTRRVVNLGFENITFAHQTWELPLACAGYIQAAYGVPGAIILQGAEDCVFYGCTIAHVSGYGLEVLAGSTRNTIAGCSIYDTGAGGVKIGHEEMNRTDATGDGGAPGTNVVQSDVPPLATTIVDCTIRDCGHLFPSAIGIWVGNSGWNRLIHNHIFNCNYTGISCGWTWGYAPTRTVGNRIEFNHIHHINHREILSDNGAIYTLGQQPGMVMRGNVIHDISCYGYGAWGLYPDEGSSEMRVEQNLICGTKKAAFFMHYGRDNLVQNNIFALSQEDHLGLGKREGHRSTLLRRNIILPCNGRITGRFDTAQYTLANNLFWSQDGSPISFGGRPLSELEAAGQGKDAWAADPLFADPVGGDFSLRPDSPALGMGFKTWDWRIAGPRVKSQRHRDYDAYVEKFPLPVMDTPVIRTRIELLTPPNDLAPATISEFEVIITNVGHVKGTGALRLASGPTRLVGRPDIKRIDFSLEPGAESRHKVSIKPRDGTREFWLETDPTTDVCVPARKLVLDPSQFAWSIACIAHPTRTESVAGLVAKVKPRAFYRGKALAAEVKLAASSDALIFWARYLEPQLRPDFEQPWKGTGFELISHASGPARPTSGKWQVCLVPTSDGSGVVARKLNDLGSATDPAPLVLTTSKPIEGGCEFVAIIPWSEFGQSTQPEKLQFQLVVDVVHPQTCQIIQLVAFDPVADGTKQLPCHLIVNTPTLSPNSTSARAKRRGSVEAGTFSPANR